MIKKILIISIFFCLFNSISYAQEALDLEKYCREYTRHTAEADVSYQPGVDVSGNTVLSADIDDNRLQIPRVYRIPLKVEQLDVLNLPVNSILTPELSVGEVVVDLDADTVMFNGQDIKRSELEVLCLKPNIIQIEDNTN